MMIANEDYCMVHFLGNIDEGEVMLMEKKNVKDIRCFICGNKVHPDEIVVMSFTAEDMVCVCKRHMKHRYPYGTFENVPHVHDEKRS